MRRLTLIPALALLAACGDLADHQPAELTGPDMAVVDDDANFVDMANDLLAAQGSEYRIATAEIMTTTSGHDEANPNVIVARDVGNKRLQLDFIPDDPRRGGVDGDPNTIDVWVDVTQGTTANGISAFATTNAIARAMTTWDGQRCSDLTLTVTPVAVDIGLVQAALGFGGTGIAVSDIMHAGWLPGGFFDLIRPGGSASILGVTFTLTFVDDDLNGDGLPDLGAREIYYNDAFAWADDGTGGIDVETIALHEAGHGLSQAHFGKIFINSKNGKVHFSPRAVMNAVYSGVQRSLAGTDRGGHCGLWANWP